MSVPGILLVLFTLIAGCSKTTQAMNTLQPPPDVTPAVAAELQKGNALFASRDWSGAEQAYRHTIVLDPSVAEAHYNLGVTLDRMGNPAEARKHYMEAANLAPGNKVIWDSPPLRSQQGGLQHDISKKSYQDPTYKGF
ncbi:conserved exported protein of unknown function [Nitrospira sp. KM1]|uniref:tetratricopeptide repeat protein n=1 Tax=Nitrospira sp. KM1 TaxID=1936990 RepID=UPI0013A719EF|nr:tetratricopeptide repeat protein [Nitrospira sp. KM1]BCA53490.1 conserved exported protein of unknown function [Nitrospira sp. KM1]